jgi:putative transposase
MSIACALISARSWLVIRQVCRNVKRWRDAQMALRWTAAGMLEAGKGFRRLKAYKQLPNLKVALAKHRAPETDATVDPLVQAA